MTWSWRSETEGRLRKAEISLEAARALIERKPPCIDDAVNRASAAALQAARALVDARWPPAETEVKHDPTWRPGMPRQTPLGPYSKASWHEIVKQFEQAAHEMVLPSDATEYLKALVEDGQIADVGESATYEADEAHDAVRTAEKLVKSVAKSIQLAFTLGHREVQGKPGLGDTDENETTLEVLPLVMPPHSEPLGSAAATDPGLPSLGIEAVNLTHVGGTQRDGAVTEPPPAGAPGASETTALRASTPAAGAHGEAANDSRPAAPANDTAAPLPANDVQAGEPTKETPEAASAAPAATAAPGSASAAPEVGKDAPTAAEPPKA